MNRIAELRKELSIKKDELFQMEYHLENEYEQKINDVLVELGRVKRCLTEDCDEVIELDSDTDYCVLCRIQKR